MGIAGQTMALTIKAPAFPDPEEPIPMLGMTPPAARERSGWSPYVTYVGAAATVALSGVSVWSAYQVKSVHERYVGNPTHHVFEDGVNLQRRTNIFWGGTALLGVATAVIAVFVTDWSSDDEDTVALGMTAGHRAGRFSVGGRF